MQDWFSTELGLQAFIRAVKFFTTREEYELMVRWASRREPHLREAEIEWIEARAAIVAELLKRWEPIGVQAASRYVAEQVELTLD